MQRQRQENSYIRKIEFAFYNEAEIRAAIEEARLDSSPPEIRNGSGISDPTASAVIKKLSPVQSVTIHGVELKRPESWLFVIDKTYAWCRRQGTRHYEIARARYSGGYFRPICAKLAISETQFYMTLERIRIYAALQAAQLNLIYVE